MKTPPRDSAVAGDRRMTVIGLPGAKVAPCVLRGQQRDGAVCQNRNETLAKA